jgi:hypothetical protein
VHLRRTTVRHVGSCAVAILGILLVTPRALNALGAPSDHDVRRLVLRASLPPARVKVTTTPQTARIDVNGVLTGTGKVVVMVPKATCITVEVKLEGYIQETRTYCNTRGMTPPPKADYVKLQPDESYTSSVQSDSPITRVC